ncbi:DUF3482 domain-containing protein [Aromatoleum aromaticum]|uniref:G domain-containing protein n=1 Tax=Aromatoleum aromaticum (strain DSM 19018 / LMG 30748 / EbN1) TaxID=76114 RepID=Q5P913_AROAE|nr:DUF3482 domain-containing protein [Aromatoleum aromaticum]NMG54959.1 DUF3482 domain-containing protein [Aromatoleum aromaticum]CAI06196.1 conserved hypothetical protein [Aromatoleum aromaticum EbN1]
MTRPLRIAVVGHTNTGKTSLMRTLTRDTGFGEVSSRPSTTRHVEGARLLADGEVLVELYDTPGLEDPIALLERLEAIEAPGGERLDDTARIERFLATPVAGHRFEQEAKVLRQMLASDAAFYVVDVRDPVLAKHRDELTILGSCAIPLLPVLNFVRDSAANESSWREALARLGLHAIVRFDTVAPERDGERRLYEKLATLVDVHRPALERLVACREREARTRHDAALSLVAELLVDVAAARVAVATEAQAIEHAVVTLHEHVRRREQACVDALLALYRFRSDDVDAGDLPLLDGRWENDLFNPETFRAMGVRLGTGAAAGAAAGVGIDLMLGGLTLGTAAALGALAGGGWQAVRQFGDRVVEKLRGQRELSVDDAILRLLALRQLRLIDALETRGHAAMAPIRLVDPQLRQWREGPIPEPLLRARAHQEWSELFGAGQADDARQEAVDTLAQSFSEAATATA